MDKMRCNARLSGPVTDVLYGVLYPLSDQPGTTPSDILLHPFYTHRLRNTLRGIQNRQTEP